MLDQWQQQSQENLNWQQQQFEKWDLNAQHLNERVNDSQEQQKLQMKIVLSALESAEARLLATEEHIENHSFRMEILELSYLQVGSLLEFAEARLLATEEHSEKHSLQIEVLENCLQDGIDKAKSAQASAWKAVALSKDAVKTAQLAIIEVEASGNLAQATDGLALAQQEVQQAEAMAEESQEGLRQPAGSKQKCARY